MSDWINKPVDEEVSCNNQVYISRGVNLMTIPVDSRARALIFDIDGTLADTMPVHYHAWQEICAKIGFDYPEEVFYELAGIPTHKIIHILNERYGLSMNNMTVEEKEAAYMRRIDEIKPIVPVIEVARKYKGVLPMSCGTGGRIELALLALKSVDLENFFDTIIASEDVTNHKPEPDTFLLCAERMRVNPRDCLVFEDGELGLEAARRAGMMFVDVRPYLKK